MGGLGSEALNAITKQIWHWCIDRGNWVLCEHVPGIENCYADHLPRFFNDNIERSSVPKVFDQLCAEFFALEIDLRRKVVTLLCLASFGCVHTISLIRKSNVDFLANKSAIIFIYDDLKVKRRRRPRFILEFPHFNQDRCLSVAHSLRLYLHRTRFLRALSQYQLFISYSPPHKPVTKDSLSRWVKNILRSAAIDVSIFTAHSVRGASSSASRSTGLSLPFILSREDWSTDKESL